MSKSLSEMKKEKGEVQTGEGVCVRVFLFCRVVALNLYIFTS